MQYYILVDKDPVPEPDFGAWVTWYVNFDHRVDETQVGHLIVTTVFTGLNHAVSGPPQVFETTIVNLHTGETTNPDERCATWEEALCMHRQAVERARLLID